MRSRIKTGSNCTVEIIFQANLGLDVILQAQRNDPVIAKLYKIYTNKNPIGPETICVLSGFASPKLNS